MSAERRPRYLRVVRPGSGVPPLPPMPVQPPSAPPLWLDQPPMPSLPPELLSLGTPLEDATEAALRAGLHAAVHQLQPAPHALEQLRRAVPQRKALKRRAWGGAAVAASLALLGLTTLHSLSVDTVSTAQSPQGGQHQPGLAPTGSGHHHGHGATGGSNGNPAPDGSVLASLLPSPAAGGVLVPLPSGGVTQVAIAPATHSQTPPGRLPECTRGQLGRGAAGLAPTGAGGLVYGSFAVTNVSAHSCQVSGSGLVEVLSVVGTDPGRITVQPHSAADPAQALPAPGAIHQVVALTPGSSYVIDFAWVPNQCTANTPDAGASGSPASPAALASGGVAPAAGTASTGGVTDSASGSAAPSSPGPGSPSPGGSPTLELAHVPASGGAAAASATLTLTPDASCGGTVYRTDPLAAPR